MTARRRVPARPPVSPAGALLDPRELKKLIVLMQESGLVELEIESGGEKVRLVRGRVVAPPLVAPPAPTATQAERGEVEAEGGARAVTAPMVGTFHRAAALEAPAFVEVGDVVERGQLLCLIEAMGMMNEIEAEFPGRVTAVAVENGRPVEYGETLFLIEPI